MTKTTKTTAPRRALLLASTLWASLPALAAADFFHVGPFSEYATISEALAIATSVEGDHEIRVRAGTYAETLSLNPDHAGRVVLIGGWDDDFIDRDLDPRATVVDAQRLGPVLTIQSTQTEMLVRGFTFRGGLSSSRGAGIVVSLGGTADLTLADCHLLDNRVEANSAAGAGLSVVASDQADFVAERLRIEGNVAAGTLQGASAGLEVYLNDLALGQLFDNVIRANRTEGANEDNPPTGAWFFVQEDADLVVTRNLFFDNEGPGAASPHVAFLAQDGATRVTDSVVAGGGQRGLFLFAQEGTIHAANLTVADHPASALTAQLVDQSGTIDVANCLFFGNGAPATFDPGITRNHNLDGVDPRFADPTARDYRLLAGSPAIDAGNNDPIGGLGELDASGHARVLGAAVDIGAHEHGPYVCAPSDTVLCLTGERFQVDVTWRRTDGTLAEAENVELTEDSGFFWFFTPSNVEMLVKALDACVINDRFWFSAGGLTDVEVSTRVTDTATGDIRVYRNPASQAFESVLDSDAFPGCGVAAEPESSASRSRTVAVVRTRTQAPASTATGSAAACVATPTTLCLGTSRFAVTAAWRSDVDQGDGNQGVLTADTGTFWFFSSNNLEVVLKVLDACSINQHYWVYAAGLTDVEVILTVTDTISGETVTYTNPLGQLHETITDVEALPCS